MFGGTCSLTPAERAAIARSQASLDALKWRVRADGRVTMWERARINAAQAVQRAGRPLPLQLIRGRQAQAGARRRPVLQLAPSGALWGCGAVASCAASRGPQAGVPTACIRYVF